MTLTVYTRLDKYLANQGYAGNQDSARQMIEGGKVMINGQIITIAGFPMHDSFRLQIIGKDFSTSAINRMKLDFALGAFNLQVAGLQVVAICAPNSGYPAAFAGHGAQNVFTPEDENAPFTFIFCDLAHLSLKKSLAPLMEKSGAGTSLLASIRPQDELESDSPVLDPVQQRTACGQIEAWLKESGWTIMGFTPNPAEAVDGNREFFVYAVKA